MKIAKWGNSYAVRLPQEVMDAFSLKGGDELEVDPAGEPGVLRLVRKMTVDEQIETLRKFRGRMPKGFRFDRDEANAR